MQFGQRKADAPEQTGEYLRRFMKGETKVRFIDEPDDWIVYKEHRIGNNGFPCTEDHQTCPGCTHELEDVRKAKRRYATQVLLVKQSTVLPFVVPVSLADRLSVRFERNDKTLLNRDYVVLRSGEGLDTEYDVDQEDKYPMDIAELHRKITITVQECLQASFREVWGSPEAPQASADTKNIEREAKQEEKPPSEPVSQSASEATPADDILTEAQVRAMSKPQLIQLCETAGILIDDDTKSELVAKLLKEYGE